jgi:hypothetical protein
MSGGGIQDDDIAVLYFYATQVLRVRLDEAWRLTPRFISSMARLRNNHVPGEG